MPLKHSPKDDHELLFFHNSVTPYYLRNQKILDTEGKVILDAGCGSGHRALALAIANPGAKIVGIDISEQSVKLARQRLDYHQVETAEFYVASIEEVPSLGIEFDYINCDEVLYLLPDIVKGLQALKLVLKADGIIRTNLHSALQRHGFYRAQELFRMMGLMDETPGEMEVELSREIILALKDRVFLRANTWDAKLSNNSEEWILSNYLLQGDRGYTIPDTFAALEAAELEFISMVNWRHWELMDLFQDPENLPAFLGMSLPDISVPERLHLFELLQPIHRLLDFWCGHTQAAQPFLPLSDWTEANWQGARVQLHPNLKTPQTKQDLIDCIANRGSWEISQYVKTPTKVPIIIESAIASCLLPLWESPQPVSSLAERWRRVRPVDPTTLEEVDQYKAMAEVTDLLGRLETFLYILLERSL